MKTKQEIKSPQAHYKKGKENKITFIFSCPGKAEKNADPPQPVFGLIRKNVETFWAMLNNDFKTNDYTRDNITISNAFKDPHYGKGKTEARDSEIKLESNLTRLYNEIEHTEELIVCSGNKAQLAINEIRKRKDLKLNCKKIISIPHLGYSSLNQIRVVGKSPAERSEKRLKVVLEEFKAQFT